MLVPVDEASRDIKMDWGEDRDSGYMLAAGAFDDEKLK